MRGAVMKRNTPKKNNQLLIKLNDAELERLENLSKDYGQTKSFIVRQALQLMKFKKLKKVDEKERRVRADYERMLADNAQRLSEKNVSLQDMMLKILNYQLYITRKYEGEDFSKNDIVIDMINNVEGLKLSAVQNLEKMEALE